MVNSNFVQLGEISEAIRGVTFSGGEAVPDAFENSLACLTTSGVQEAVNWDSRRFIPRGRLSNSKQLLQEGDILISTANSKELVGKSCIVDRLPFEATFGAFVTVIRPNKKVLPEFVAYWMKTKEFLDKCYVMSSNTTNISNLRTSELLEFQIPLPPLTEQKRIASLLARADRLRSLRRRAHNLGESLLQSVFLEMFGDPGINPKNWEILPISDLLSKTRNGLQTGPFGSSLKRHEYVAEGIPVWGINNLGENRFFEDDPLYITEEKFQQLQNYTVEKGDIFISRAGTVGRMCVAYPSISPSIIGTNLVRISLDFKIINPEYFTALFSYFGSRFASLKMTDDENAYSFINPSILRTMRIPVPPLNLQEEFAGVVARVESLRGRMSEAGRQVEGLFESLLAESFGG